MNVPEDYDDEAERKATHPDLLPKDGWSDPEEQADNRAVIKKAVALLGLKTMARRGVTPSGHRRSVLRNGRFGGQVAQKRVSWSGSSLSSCSGGNQGTVLAGTRSARTADSAKTSVQLKKELERRNQYLLALIKLRLGRVARAT